MTARLQSPMFWQSVVESIPDLVTLVDAEGQILFANRAPAGRSPADVVGTSVFNFVREESRDELRESLRKVIANGKAQRRQQEGLLPDGTSAWYSVHTSPVFHDGVAVAAVIVARDITERRRTQLALLESEARFRTLVENAPEAIVVYDIDADRFVHANRNACELFGMPLSRLVLSSPASVSPEYQPDGRPSSVAAAEYLGEALNGHTPTFEWVHTTAKGDELRCEVRLVRLPSDRRLVRGSIIDRTERIRMDEQMAQWQKMDALGQLAAGIAHDFNSVLTVIGTTAEELEGTPGLDAQPLEDARAIRAEVTRGAALTSRLLAFSRKQSLPAEIIDLNEVVRSLTLALRRVIPARIELVEELHAGGATITLHHNQVEQIVMNLLLNARDAIDGNGTITISTRCSARGSVMLSVRDTGRGMGGDILARSLEPFFSTKPAGEGTGLGLSTVHSIIKRAGGAIAIDSAPGRGTSVSITLPSDSCGDSVTGK